MRAQVLSAQQNHMRIQVFEKRFTDLVLGCPVNYHAYLKTLGVADANHNKHCEKQFVGVDFFLPFLQFRLLQQWNLHCTATVQVCFMCTQAHKSTFHM